MKEFDYAEYNFERYNPILDEDHKYFFEPRDSPHYDRRYFHHLLSSNESKKTLYSLYESWVHFAQSRNISSWLAHGSLIGWFWGGDILPWDDDLDVQMFCGELDRLFKENIGNISDFEFIINPHYILDRPLQNNKIDARLVDKSNGKFIDVTCLFETEDGYFSCKQPHIYSVTDILPLTATLFRGIPSFVPRNFVPILVEEYGVRAQYSPRHTHNDGSRYHTYLFNNTSHSSPSEPKEGKWRQMSEKEEFEEWKKSLPASVQWKQ